jgi:hypothetical protein
MMPKDRPAQLMPTEKKLTRAEKALMNKAAQAALHEQREAEKALRAQEKADLIARARADARARAQQALEIDAPRSQGEVRQIAKSLVPIMLQTLLEIALDPMQQASGRVSAANALIDRAHGKAIQPTTELPAGVFEEMDDAALDAYVISNAKKFIDGKVIEDVQRRRNGNDQSDPAVAAETVGIADSEASRRTGGARGNVRKPRVGGAGGKRQAQK